MHSCEKFELWFLWYVHAFTHWDLKFSSTIYQKWDASSLLMHMNRIDVPVFLIIHWFLNEPYCIYNNVHHLVCPACAYCINGLPSPSNLCYIPRIHLSHYASWSRVLLIYGPIIFRATPFGQLYMMFLDQTKCRGLTARWVQHANVATQVFPIGVPAIVAGRGRHGERESGLSWAKVLILLYYSFLYRFA